MSNLLFLQYTLHALAAIDPSSVFDLGGLIGDVSAWLTGLIPTGGALMVGYHALAKNGATDDTVAAQHSRAQRNVLVGTMIGTGASALIKFLSGYVAQETLNGGLGMHPRPPSVPFETGVIL
jgi:hypothetical protein